MNIKAIITATGALLVGLAASPSARADDLAAFYSSHPLNFIIPTTAGGGFDLYSRVLMDYMRKYIPGQPTIVMQNLVGAGGVRPANYVYNAAPRDGSVIGMPLSNIPFTEALDPDAVKVRSANFTWIGTITPETEVLGVLSSSGVANLNDTLRKELVIGGTSKLGMPTLNAAMVKALLGSKFKIVIGYPAGNEIVMAMDKGEIQGRFNEWTSWKTQRPQWIEDKFLNYIIQIGPKEPELPDVPSLLDFVKAPNERAMVRLMQSNQLVGRSIYAPPGLPADRTAALREAFDKTMRDPAFLERMRTLGLEVNPTTGQDLQAEIDRTMGGAEEVVRDIKRLLNL